MPTTQNSSINALYQSLCAQQDALSAAIQSTTNPALAKTLSTENYEIMHRIILAQNLLFQQDSAELKQCVTDVSNASGKIQSCLAGIQKASDIINTISDFLVLVDKAIDLAKTLAPMAA